MNPLTWPRWLQTVVAIVVLYIAFRIWLDLFHDPAVVDRHEAKIAGEVEAISTEAAAAASSAVAARQTEVEQANEQARAAAAGSADPLKSGFDQLRRTRPTETAAR